MPRERRFRVTPEYLRRLRRGARYREYGRFYELYENWERKRKRASFQVRISPNLSGRRKHRLIASVVNALLDKKVPVHEQGQVFSSFSELFRTRWVRVRKILRYQAGVVYER